MTSLVRAARVACSVLLATPFLAFAADPAKPSIPAEIPIDHFVRDPEFDQIQLSPDGRKVAAIVSQGDAANLFVIDLATKQPRAVTGFRDRGVQTFHWVGSDRLIYTVYQDGELLGGLFAVNADGKQPRTLVASAQEQGVKGAYVYRGAAYLGPLGESTTEVLVIANDRNEYENDVYRMNVMNGRKTLVARNPGGVRHWVADSKGVVRAAFGEKGVERFALYRPDGNAEWKEVRRSRFTEGDIIPLNFDAQDRLIYVTSDVGRDTAGIFLFDPSTGELGDHVYSHDRYDMDDVLFSRFTRKLLGVRYQGERLEMVWLDPELAGIQKMLDEELKGTRNRIYSRSRDGNWIVVLASSDRDPGTFYLFNPKELTLETLVRRASWIDPKLMSEMRPITYTARDGLRIDGYLTLPVGREPRNLPLIVNPHGGPWVRDTWGYNPEVQFLASRGYAVLQMNFRGSTGYGRKHLTSGYGQWGLAMQDDITDGVKWAVEQGYADPQRVAIFGGSYGGYATMAGLTTTPELYRCGINYVGVTDIDLLLRTIPDAWESSREVLETMTGSKEERQARLERVSPLRNVDRIRAPLFLAYGELDERVDMKHVTRLVNELKKHGKPYELMVRSNEGHGFYKEENAKAFYLAIEKFLAEHLR